MSRAPVDLQRMRHVPRQMLRSRDFRDQGVVDAELRWWHQRAVHDAFGVADGLTVTPFEEVPNLFTVAPGLAYDCYGRELRLRAPRTVAGPGLSKDELTLVARFAGDGTEADLVWLLSDRVRPETGVPLTHHPKPADPAAVPYARPLASPRVHAGATQPGATAWEPWDPPGLEGLGVQVRIDTSPAGFSTVPCYFASLQWPHVPEAGVRSRIIRALGLQYVQLEAVDGFSFCVVLPLGDMRLSVTGSEGSAVGFARNQRLYVCWIGIEHERPR
jgi:hypothetical protein